MITIRKALKEDAAEIHRLFSVAFSEIENQYTKGAYDITVVSTSEVQDRIDEDSVWIALDGDEIAGTISAIWRENEFYIRGFAVLPRYRGQKIGYRLLAMVEDLAIQRGYPLLTLITTAYLDDALKLYKRFGFKIINALPYEMYGTPCINMHKAISE